MEIRNILEVPNEVLLTLVHFFHQIQLWAYLVDLK